MISVIIPVYNVERYLRRCLNSVINQTYKDLEIILIDDGSIDSSGKICDEYSNIDERIVVIHKKNHGLSSARNKGLDVAKGKYIGFVDSDDFIHPQMYELLYKAITEKKLDMVSCKTRDTDSENVKMEQYNDIEELQKMEIVSKKDIFDNFSNKYYERIWMTAMHKLYKRKIFDDIRFMEGKIYEDEFIFHHIIDKCTNVGIMQTVLYYYYLSSNSITRSKFTKSRFDIIDATYDRFNFFLEKKVSNEIDYWGTKCIGQIIEMWHKVYFEELTYKKYFKKTYIKKLRDKKLLKCSLSIKQRIHIWFVELFPEIEASIYKRHYR